MSPQKTQLTIILSIIKISVLKNKIVSSLHLKLSIFWKICGNSWSNLSFVTGYAF